MSLQRTGITKNAYMNQNIYTQMQMIADKITSLTTFEQVLGEEMGYNVETYGKVSDHAASMRNWVLRLYESHPLAHQCIQWHAPFTFLKGSKDKTRRVVTSTVYNFTSQSPVFRQEQNVKGPYKENLDYLLEQEGIGSLPLNEGDLVNEFSGQPYTPVSIDPRYGYPSSSRLSDDSLEKWQRAKDAQTGRDALSYRHTATGIIGQSASRALDRLIATGRPFSLGVHFNVSHK